MKPEPSPLPLKLALCQFNPLLGDVKGNRMRIEALARQAHAEGARLAVFPELGLTGYPPEDLLLRPAFLEECRQQLDSLCQSLADLPDLTVVLGHPALAPRSAIRHRSVQQAPCINAATAFRGGQVLCVYAKRELPNYQVFDEKRYFMSGRDLGWPAALIDIDGHRLALLICEDAWKDEAIELALQSGADSLLVLNASPFHRGKSQERERVMAEQAQKAQRALVYAHLVGGQDEIVFDGSSFSVSAQGEVCARAQAFQEELLTLTWSAEQRAWHGKLQTMPGELEQLWAALVLGIKDYVGKNGFPGVIIGLSGGIDSALVLALAVDALGADKVRTVMMPSRYTADISWTDARAMAERLGVRYDEIPIEPMVQAFGQALAPEFQGLALDATEENIQARTRGVLLMALSNKFGSIVLTTGNKSEMATGYCTLYGDMAGGFAVIKDLAKTVVFELAKWRNDQARLAGQTEVIPERIISRPPSAELRPDQTDQDSLPPYEVLDAILQRYMEEDQSIEDIIAAGFDDATVRRVARLIKLNEYKRRQAPVGIRVTHRAFGRDWRYPITSKFVA